MSYIGKEYKFVKQENFDGFLRSVGLPEEGVQKFIKFNPSSKLVQNGDTYTYITSTPEGTKEVTFKSGVQFDDVVGDNIPIKSTYTVSGNTVTQVVTQRDNAGKSVTFKREYTEDELVVVITASDWDGTARRYYKA